LKIIVAGSHRFENNIRFLYHDRKSPDSDEIWCVKADFADNSHCQLAGQNLKF